jgi:hypothetical protein
MGQTVALAVSSQIELEVAELRSENEAENGAGAVQRSVFFNLD